MSYTICSRFKGEHIVYAGYTICTSREHIVYGAFCGSTQHEHGLNHDFTRLNFKIDRIYISDFLAANIKNVIHLDYLADHKPVFWILN